MGQYFDNRLRPAIELLPAIVTLSIAYGMWQMPNYFYPFIPEIPRYMAVALMCLAFYHCAGALFVLRYQHGLVQLPRYILNAHKLPWSSTKLFIGKGFRWRQQHSQRLLEARSPLTQQYLQLNPVYRWVRRLEFFLGQHKPFIGLSLLLAAQSWANPFRARPQVGGDCAIHGVGMEDEHTVWMDLSERVGHTLVLGTTRVGKSRFAELLIAQDIRRGDIVIVFDPKGDVDLLKRMHAEAKRANRLHQFHLFHLGHPEISEKYNAVGEFSRITEVASRATNPLPSTGSSAAFKEFSWRFTNIVARALVGLGRKPTFSSLARYVTHIEPLYIDYMHLWLDSATELADWRQQIQVLENDKDLLKRVPMSIKSRGRYAVALWDFYRSRHLFDPVVEGLKGILEYDKTYYDKLTASLLPLLEKLTSGKSGELLAPDYHDHQEKRPILDWRKVIREGGIVYVGLDAQTDSEVASAVGSAMFSDLTSVSGELYKFGDTHGLPTIGGHTRPKIALHTDEFESIIGPDFIPMINRSGGSGVQVTAYTQTASDIEAGIGTRPQAGQIFGNFNTLFMLRVKSEETAKVLTDQLPKIRLYTKTTESRVTDNVDSSTSIDFVSQNMDRLQETESELLTPADLVQLPKGQAFALIEGGQLYKLRLPLAGKDPLLPKGIEEIAKERNGFYGLSE
ncbi:MAG: type IV conjugative transfer system coupling protein TraD [Spongiibacteraceae bacterium]|nr:type IV conjugative transfer system coupling protein TraD [Spongiibacteraceae bacterium]